MSIELPDELARVMNLIGLNRPDGDEDELCERASPVREFAALRRPGVLVGVGERRAVFRRGGREMTSVVSGSRCVG
ncbi:hypothetical protein [Kitasatospora sp. NPDC088134]|uniref:hypothetical protein n=1 Tax=Kitasatospora sp. NPDC088134 TaxID=3364071 RepID=UPI003808DB2A